MHNPPTISVERIGSVGVVTFNRPGRLNAYTPDMGDELVDAFRALSADTAVGAIVVTGSGRAFCAGADRDFLNGQPSRTGKQIGEEHFIAGFAEELFSLHKPTIAAVNGPAVGIGVTMLLPFDFRIAGMRARFGFPFAGLGLMPGMGSTYLLPAIVGPAQAKQILLLGKTINAQDALDIGLVHEVVDDSALFDHALALGVRLAEHDRSVLAGCKCALNHQSVAALREAVQREREETRRLAENRPRTTDRVDGRPCS